MKTSNNVINPLLAAIVAVSAVSVVNAKSVDLVLLGYGLDQNTQIQGLPTPGQPGSFYDIPTLPALYQVPRLGSFGGAGVPSDNAEFAPSKIYGSGWPGELEMTLDTLTNVVSGFKMTLTENQYFASGVLQGDVRVAGRHYVAGDDFNTCITTNPIDANDQILEIDCTVPATTGVGRKWIELNSPGYLCMTTLPMDTNPGLNGCGIAWSGDFTGASGSAAANPEVTVIPENSMLNPSWGGYKEHAKVVGSGNMGAPGTGSFHTQSATSITFGIAGTNDSYGGTGDASQNALALTYHEVQGVRAGGKFTITHTGNTAADFEAVSVDYRHETDISFPTAVGTLAYAQSFTDYTFDHIVTNQVSDAADSTKNVPAMGAFGLAALFGGLVAVAARLRRRVS